MTPRKVVGYFQKDFFEKQCWSQNKTIAGIDEVGRGCVMGPLVVACAVLPGLAPSFIKDSKSMSPQARKDAYEWIMQHCYSTYSIMNTRLIDKYNIYQSALLTMRKVALQSLIHYQIDTFLVDAMPLDLSGIVNGDCKVYYFNKAESYSSSVAAASIVAKVVRDQLMERLGNSFINYGLEKHKGYPTPSHRQSVLHNNSNFLYRKSFLTCWPY